MKKKKKGTACYLIQKGDTSEGGSDDEEEEDSYTSGRIMVVQDVRKLEGRKSSYKKDDLVKVYIKPTKCQKTVSIN